MFHNTQNTAPKSLQSKAVQTMHVCFRRAEMTFVQWSTKEDSKGMWRGRKWERTVFKQPHLMHLTFVSRLESWFLQTDWAGQGGGIVFLTLLLDDWVLT